MKLEVTKPTCLLLVKVVCLVLVDQNVRTNLNKHFSVRIPAWHGFSTLASQMCGIQAGHTFLCEACHRTSTALMRPSRLKQPARLSVVRVHSRISVIPE